MLKHLSRIGLSAAFLINIAACSQHSAATLIPGALNSSGSPTNSSAKSFSNLVGKTITPAQVEEYIDPSVVGPDRELARRLMTMMPASKRGDFIYFDNPNHIVSNRRDLATSLTVRKITPRIQVDSKRFTKSYPPSLGGTTGPYARGYSRQGMTAAVAYVSVPCNDSSFQSGDEGYTYIETADRNGGLTEGGLSYQNGGSIIPYYSTGTFQNLHNSFTYSCSDGPIGMMKGHLPEPSSQLFFVSGKPATPPSSVFANPNSVVWNNAEWNFFNDNNSYGPAGTDPSGIGTPCTQCWEATMTTIGQNGGTRNDGSYFGVGDGYLGIHWQDVEFGELSSNCHGQVNNTPGTGQCTMNFNSDPNSWFSGFQYWPDNYAAQNDPDSPGSPFESDAGIDSRQIGNASYANRQARDVLSAPKPPAAATCSDVQSWMSANTSNGAFTGTEPSLGSSYTFSGGSVAIYQGSSSTPIPDGMGGYDNLLNTSWSLYPGTILTGADLYDDIRLTDRWSCN